MVLLYICGEKLFNSFNESICMLRRRRVVPFPDFLEKSVNIATICMNSRFLVKTFVIVQASFKVYSQSQ